MTHAHGPAVLILVFLLAAAAPAPAPAQTAAVLAVVPEGAVIDAAPFPDLETEARFSFRRSEADATELAQGSVLDVREGHALVGLQPQSGVQVGDVALRCASPDSQAALQATIEQIKAQASGGSATPEIEQLVSELDATAEERDTAIREGACDVSPLDQKLAELGMQLQQAVAPAPAADASAPPPDSPEGAPDVAAAPTPTGTGAGIESLEQFVEVVGRLFQMAQSLGLGPGGGRSDSGSQTESSASPPPLFGSDSGVAPPIQTEFDDPGSGAVAPPPPPPTTGGIEAPPSSPPPVAGGSSEIAPPSPQPAPPQAGGAPPSTDASPPPAPPTIRTPPIVTVPRPGGLRPVPGRGVSPPVADPSVAVDSSAPKVPWWMVAKPKRVPPAASGLAPIGSVPILPTPAPRTSLQPGIAAPGARAAGPMVAAKPGLIRGSVLAAMDGGPGGQRPLAGASVLVSDGRPGATGRRVTTNQQGLFAVAGLVAGRYSVAVTAAGFRSTSAPVSVSPGRIAAVRLTLQRQAAPAPPQRVPAPTPGGLAPPGAHLQPRTGAVAGTGTIGRVQPPQPPASVQGLIRGDNGQPLPDALVSVGGRQVKTNRQGVFLMANVPPGRQTLVVIAGGFAQGRLSLELTSGEVERVALTLRRTR